MNIALSQVRVVIVDVFPPVLLVILKTDIQPGFHHSVIVYHCRLLDVGLPNVALSTQPKEMPSPVQSQSLVVEGDPP